jgi:hypothetical protein
MLQDYWSDLGVSNFQGVCHESWSKKYYESLIPSTSSTYYYYVATMKSILSWPTSNKIQNIPRTRNWTTNLMAEIRRKLRMCQQYFVSCNKSLEGIAVLTRWTVHSDGSFHVTVCSASSKILIGWMYGLRQEMWSRRVDVSTNDGDHRLKASVTL